LLDGSSAPQDDIDPRQHQIKLRPGKSPDSHLAYDEALRKAGHLIVVHALQPVEAATTVRVRNGKLSATDGPFAETKEQLGGFYLIEAKDMDEACEVAARFPPARVGIIEVRAVRERRHSLRG
jgi:hypothetical protein